MKSLRIPRRAMVFLLAACFSTAVAASLVLPRVAPSTKGGFTLTVSLLNQDEKLPSTNYIVELFEYKSSAQSILAPVATAQLNSGGTVTLHDTTNSQNSSLNVHYSLLVVQMLQNGTTLLIMNYHWTSPTSNTSSIQLTIMPDSKVRFVMNGKVVPYIVHVPSNQNSEPAAKEILLYEWPITTLSKSMQAISP